MMKTVARALVLGTVASLIFYCGAASRGMPDAGAQDAGLDAGSPDGDAGADPCVVCPEPEPPEVCPNCQRFRTVDIITTVDASAFVPLPHWSDPGTVVQTWERVFALDASYWAPGNDGPCRPFLFTEAPHYAPNLPVPALYFHPGEQRQCRVVITEPEQPGG